jgi:hypothetical protein
MKALGLAVGAIAVTGMMAAPQQAQAGTRVGIEVFLGFGGHSHGNEAYRAGYERGYREGAGRGVRDADHRHQSGFDHDKAYRCADAGYKGHYGPKAYYKTGFRRGYEIAYRDAYARRCRERDRRYGRRRGYDRGRWLDDGYGRHDRGRDWDDR